ncbi:MAG: site-2 protease family protein, partial [Chloroflexi bacterium]|nr:site-2 protease family protein [Chloroflexota bacterium]
MSGGLPIVRLFGIEIRISLAWAVVLAMVALIGVQQAAATAPQLMGPIHWVIGAVVALGFLASVIAHELGHALVGRGCGVETTSIQLGFVGGLAPLSIEASRPRDELAIALAGPVISLVLAAVALPLAMMIGPDGGGLSAVGGGLLVVGGLNLVLACLSLLPGMPLDGGRVVRALAWGRTGDRYRAGKITAQVGRILGWSTVGLGLALAFVDYVTEGILLLLFGWLLATGARTLDRRLGLEALLHGSTGGEATRREVPHVPPNLTIDTFAGRYEGEDKISSLVVVED